MALFNKRLHKIPAIGRFCALNYVFLALMSCWVAIIALSAALAGYEAVQRLLHPQSVGYLWAVIAASIVGFLGNEAVALFRIKVGKQIHSAALIADGYHARVDGLTSLAVLFGAVSVWLGYPLADPIVGLLITLVIVQIVWQSSKAVFIRALDGVAGNRRRSHGCR